MKRESGPDPSQVEIVAIGPGNADLLEGVGDDVFDEPIDAERLRNYIAAPGHLMLVALADRTIIGMCTAMIHKHADKLTELYVDEVGVRDDYQRLGIATRLIREMFDRGRAFGCREAWVATETDNRPARALYQSLHPHEVEDCVAYIYRLDS